MIPIPGEPAEKFPAENTEKNIKIDVFPAGEEKNLKNKAEAVGQIR